MRNQIASVLIVVTLIVGAGIGYFWRPTTSPDTTTNTHTLTTTLGEGSNLVTCVIVYYEVDNAAFIGSASTTYGSITRTHQIRNYTTMTSIEQTVGYTTRTVVSLSDTLTHTGPALASWDDTECTWVA